MSVIFHDHDQTPNRYSISFAPRGGAAEEAVVSAGYNASGGMWEELVNTQWPDLSKRVGFDSEADMFAAYGDDREALEQLQANLKAALDDPTALVATIKATKAMDFWHEGDALSP